MRMLESSVIGGKISQPISPVASFPVEEVTSNSS